MFSYVITLHKQINNTRIIIRWLPQKLGSSQNGSLTGPFNGVATNTFSITSNKLLFQLRNQRELTPQGIIRLTLIKLAILCKSLHSYIETLLQKYFSKYISCKTIDQLSVLGRSHEEHPSLQNMHTVCISYL